MRIVVLMTTWERPNLLRVSLPQIKAEAQAIGAALVIADDQSKNPETLALLDAAQDRETWVIRRDYQRSEYGQAHDYIGLNNLFALRWILENFDEAELIFKVDDDIELVPGAFREMLDARERALAAGIDLAGVTGLQTVYEERTGEVGNGYVVQQYGCFAAVLTELRDWRRCLTDVRQGTVMTKGFDWYFCIEYLRNQRPGAKFIALDPGRVKHIGTNGVHTGNADITLNYLGDMERP